MSMKAVGIRHAFLKVDLPMLKPRKFNRKDAKNAKFKICRRDKAVSGQRSAFSSPLREPEAGQRREESKNLIAFFSG